MVFSLEPVAGIEGTSAFRADTHPAPVDLILDGNEGRAPNPELLKCIAERGTEIIRRYPSAVELESRLAKRIGVDPARLLLTSGADAAIDRCCRVMLGPGREVIMPVPTFEMLPRYVALTGATVHTITWMGGNYPIEEVLARVNSSTRMIAVVSPNNPTGSVATISDVRKLAEAAPEALILIDHAYVEFADEDMTLASLVYPNVVVLRTLSKAWGMAGLRVGYAIASPQVIRWMRTLGQPFSVSGLSLLLADFRLQTDSGQAQDYVEEICRERDDLAALLNRLGVETNRSQGNFVFGRSKRAKWLRDGLASQGISVRIWPGHPDLDGTVRITCPGKTSDYTRLSRAVEATLVPDAIVFCDGRDALTGTDSGELLERLGKRTKLALVCTEPAGEAEKWMQAAGIRKHFGAVVSREGGISYGEAQETGLRLLGARQGWAVGGGEEATHASRNAGLVAIGMSPYGDELLTMGAARVLRDLRELEGLFV